MHRRQLGGVNGVDPFLHYLDDLDDDGDGNEVATDNVEQQGLVIEPPHEAVQPRQLIDQRYVSLDIGNIIPGGRVRNNPDYNGLAGNR